MKVDCQWLEDHLEGYCCDSISEEQRQASESHLRDCEHCRTGIAALNEIDPLVRRVFQYRLHQAASGPYAISRTTPLRRLALIGATAVLLVLSILLIRHTPESSPAIANRSPAEDTTTIKAIDEGTVVRTKPSDAPAAAAVEPPPLSPVAAGADVPDFAAIDLGGYPITLQSYQGHFLVMGMWSPESPETAASLESIYAAFRTAPEVKILAVSAQRQSRPAGTTFPFAFNNGSRLFGLTETHFVLVSPEGSVQLRGSLLDEKDRLELYRMLKQP